jgi:RNA polymerase sigma-70 factor (ECF subfamily)
VTAFAAACGSGDMEQLVALLDPEVVWRADGGGKVTAARPAAGGARNVARWLLALARRPPRSLRMATVNAAPGLVMRDADGVLTVIAFTIDAGRITALDVMHNPDKLAGVHC